MHVIRVRNVRHALPEGVKYLFDHGIKEDSRNGPVWVSHEPVATVYENPRERVLSNVIRDANPFFHIAESLWMLAGRDDAAFLDNFVSDFGTRFADHGRIHGAYGYRWRNAIGFDQLNVVVQNLKRDPTSRQCVIQMWDARDDTEITGGNDLLGVWKDRPCNTQVYLRVRKNGDLPVLDITVTCRSNDIILGAYGANAVHFSFLQEYLAARIGVGVGRYYQVSNNYHMYESEVKRLTDRILKQPSGNLFNSLMDDGWGVDIWLRDTRLDKIYGHQFVSDAETIDDDIVSLLAMYELFLKRKDVDDISWNTLMNSKLSALNNVFLSYTVWPMLMAHWSWKNKASSFVTSIWLKTISSPNWRQASMEWIERRTK